MHHQLPQSDNFNPISESPNTAIRRILGNGMPMQSLDMPLSDDGCTHRPTDGSNIDWGTDLSAYFDVEGFSQPTDPTHGRSPPPETTEFHRALSSGSRRRREQTSTDDDDVLSQLFNPTSSAGNLGSSPSPFDFSALPPSSPPEMHDDLPHSALLLSSPDNSPMGFSPLDREFTFRISPEKEKTSNLKHSFTPVDEKTSLDFLAKHSGNEEPVSYDALQGWLGKMSEEDVRVVSSAGEAEGLVDEGNEGDDDLFALLGPSFGA